MAANTFWIMFPTLSKHKRAFNLFWCFTVDTNMRFDWRHFQPRLCNHKHMTAPKNAILPGQNWGLCPSPVQKFRQNRHLIFNFGCFESLIFTKFLASQDRFLFSNFLPPPLQHVFFGGFFHVSTSKNLPDVPDVCPTFRARRLPDVCPTSPDVCPTSARRLPVNQKSKRLAQPFFRKFGHQQENGGFFF